MNLSRLSTSGKVVAGACVVILVLSLWPWQSACGRDSDGIICVGTSHAWQSPLSLVAMVLIALLWLEVALVEGAYVRLPALPVASWRLVRVVAALAAAVLAGISLFTARGTDPAVGTQLSTPSDAAIVSVMLAVVVMIAEYRRPQTPVREPAPANQV